MEGPGQRRGLASLKITCFWFKTGDHYSIKMVKELYPKISFLLKDSLTRVGLAYWVMCDGSLQKCQRVSIILTQGFTLSENNLAVKELNEEWGLNCTVIPHKERYWVIKTGANDVMCLQSILNPYLLPSMRSLLPYIKTARNITG